MPPAAQQCSPFPDEITLATRRLLGVALDQVSSVATGPTVPSFRVQHERGY